MIENVSRKLALRCSSESIFSRSTFALLVTSSRASGSAVTKSIWGVGII
jgi:hypothetical protein